MCEAKFAHYLTVAILAEKSDRTTNQTGTFLAYPTQRLC